VRGFRACLYRSACLSARARARSHARVCLSLCVRACACACACFRCHNSHFLSLNVSHVPMRSSSPHLPATPAFFLNAPSLPLRSLSPGLAAAAAAASLRGGGRRRFTPVAYFCFSLPGVQQTIAHILTQCN
jgi:hypothetical protein